MKLMAHTLTLLALLLFCAPATRAQSYQIIGTDTTTVAGDLTRTVITVQVGPNPLNRFLVTRVRKGVSPEAVKGTLLLLPPLGSGFQNYEVGDGGDYHKSFAGFFARRNFDVWGYSQRVQGLTAGTCESGAADCSAMADWGVQTILDDVAFVRQQIEQAHPGERPVVGGLSLGSILATAAVNAAPADYAGAILIEGTIYDTDPAVRAVNANFCAMFEDQLANGVFYDGQNTPGFKLLNHLADVDPNGPTPFPGFPAGFTNHRAWVAAMSAPPVSPTTPRPGYVFLAGSVAEDRFFFADESLIHANIRGFVDYVATRTVRDLSCGLAGERTFNDRLHNFDGPVIMFAGGKGFGPGMLDTAALLTSSRVTINYRAEYGHVDHVFSVKHLQEVEHPILKWLQKEVGRDR
ncbi:MAG TPA: alpha/beta hydrolase [Pyrinomonadaceae bacterium]|nr:alpha/beta hydrolase [Pyrinomonadaceae bacterium]